MVQLLEVNNLTTSLTTKHGNFVAIDGVSFAISPGETLGIVGESGCGKSLTALSIMGLLPTPPARVTGGEVNLRGENLLAKSERELERIRGKDMAMVFQEPMTSLNPVYTIGQQVMESIQLHEGVSRAEAKERAIELLSMVGIPSPKERLREYPHQLSGGMRQRIMIAIALACRPGLLIADEPTTALDVTIQAQILHLMKRLQQEMGTAIMLITHDLGVVASMADRVIVMYLGRIVEEGKVLDIFQRPAHPYTAGLLRSVPSLAQRSEELHQIEGMVPNPVQKPTGCSFHPRCEFASERCLNEQPQLTSLKDGHAVACWHPMQEQTREVAD